jgi:hypothetical protein
VIQGLDWATERLNHTVSLLEKTGDGYEVLDYIADHVAKEDPAVPDTMWERLLARAPQSALVNVGFAADTRHGRRDRAESFWQNSGHRVGWYNLGLVHYERGDEESLREAERWWRLAAEAGDPGAAYGLVVLLQRRATRSPCVRPSGGTGEQPRLPAAGDSRSRASRSGAVRLLFGSAVSRPTSRSGA